MFKRARCAAFFMTRRIHCTFESVRLASKRRAVASAGHSNTQQGHTHGRVTQCNVRACRAALAMPPHCLLGDAFLCERTECSCAPNVFFSVLRKLCSVPARLDHLLHGLHSLLSLYLVFYIFIRSCRPQLQATCPQVCLTVGPCCVDLLRAFCSV